MTPYIGTTPQSAVEVPAGASSALVKNLLNGTRYSFTVSASNENGEGAASAQTASVQPADTILELSAPETADSGAGASTEVGVKFSSELAGTITGIRFYKSAANTGTHVGSLWSAAGELLASATFTRRERLGLAAGELLFAGRNPGQHDLRRRLPGAGRALLRDGAGAGGCAAVESPAAGPREPRQRQRGVRRKRHQHVPGRLGRRHQLLGRRRLPADAAARAGHRRERLRRPGCGERQLERTRRRRSRQRIHDHSLRRRTGPAADDGHRNAPAHARARGRPDQRRQLHLHGAGGERQRLRPRLGGEPERDADHDPLRPGRSHRLPRQRLGAVEMGRTVQRRQPGQQLHRHPLRRR